MTVNLHACCDLCKGRASNHWCYECEHLQQPDWTPNDLQTLGLIQEVVQATVERNQGIFLTTEASA